MSVTYVLVDQSKYQNTKFEYYDKIGFLDPEGNITFYTDSPDTLFLTFPTLRAASMYAATLPFDTLVCRYIVGENYATIDNFVTVNKK